MPKIKIKQSKIILTISLIVICNGVILLSSLLNNTLKVEAASGSTAVTQQITAGTLNIASSASISLTSVAVNVSAAQNATGNLGTVTVTDSRGTGLGWSTTATSTNFVQINTPVKTSGINNTVTSSGTYNNTVGGTYTVTISTGGAVGTAQYTVSGLESQTATVTGASAVIGTRGVIAAFGAATYSIGDSWTIRVDVLPVTGFSLTPGVVTTISGSGTNVTAGSAHTFISTADATSIIVASSGYGMGSYSNNPALQLVVPAAAYAGTYTATITETVS